MRSIPVRAVIGFALLVIPLASHAQAAHDKNEVGLVIGATLTPDVQLKGGESVTLNSSLALGAEYDRRFIGQRTVLYGGADFLASPFDVKASSPPANVTPEYAYLFLTPHVRVKFYAEGPLQPWLLFGGGYADFAPQQPTAGSVKVTGSGNSGALVFGTGVDTKPLVHLNFHLQETFQSERASRFAISSPGSQTMAWPPPAFCRTTWPSPAACFFASSKRGKDAARQREG